jgi:5-deoxy-glucuronate isomerase
VSGAPVLRAAPVDPSVGGVRARVTPASAGWEWSGLEVVELPAGGRHVVVLDGAEGLLLPLAGGCSALVEPPHGAPVPVRLAGRPGVFAGPTDSAYLPVGSRVTVEATDGPARFAVATARATTPRPVRVIAPDEVGVDLRGAGRCSRQVQNYTLGTGVEVDHLLVCEVLTPGGNWSSYPPHKHDEHSDAERPLEEIYYFEVAAGPGGPGMAYQRVYGTADVLVEVRDGDTVLVPHGYHGPSMAAPGYDLYYLNVMAGPATDGRWLSVDDPAHHWVRETWAAEDVDPRLPFRPDPAASAEGAR